MHDGEDLHDDDISMDVSPTDPEHPKDADNSLVDIPSFCDLEKLDDAPPTANGGDETNHQHERSEIIGPRFPNADAPNAQWSEDNIQTEGMSRFGICVNTAAKVVVCIACAEVIRPLDLPAHFSKTHPAISIPTTFCKMLVDTYGLPKDPLRSRPGRLITAIYGLDIVDGYLSCDTCGYACKTEDRIKNHIRTTQTCNSYRHSYVQAFRSRSKQMYFGVRLRDTVDSNEDPLDPVTYLKVKFPPPPLNQVPITCPTPRDANHFLNCEHWHRHVEGKTGAEIHQVIREREPELRREVRVVVERYAKDAIHKLEKLDDEAKGAIGDYLG